MLRANPLQIEDSHRSRLFGNISGCDHVNHFSLNESNS
jgi:hypothetical protein